MLREINMHTKYYGNFLINGVDTIEEFLSLDEQRLQMLEIEEQDLPIIMRHAEKVSSNKQQLFKSFNSTTPIAASLHHMLTESGLKQEHIFILEQNGVKTI